MAHARNVYGGARAADYFGARDERGERAMSDGLGSRTHNTHNEYTVYAQVGRPARTIMAG